MHRQWRLSSTFFGTCSAYLYFVLLHIWLKHFSALSYWNIYKCTLNVDLRKSNPLLLIFFGHIFASKILKGRPRPYITIATSRFLGPRGSHVLLQTCPSTCPCQKSISLIYESIATVGEILVWWRADFQSGSRVLKGVLNLFLYISMAYNVISCQKVAENTQILKIAKFAM